MSCSNVRYIQFAWLGICLFLIYGARTNLSVAIVSMTDPTMPSSTVNWTTAQKGSILASFFYGYVASSLLYGLVSYHSSPKVVLAISGMIAGVSTIAFPFVAIHWGFTASFICRVIIGLSEGPVYPCIALLISNWAPVNERSRMHSFICSGIQLGPAVMNAITGLLSGSAAGWPASFYFSGACLFLGGLLTIFIVVDSPNQHKSISSREKLTIELGRTYNSEKNRSVPWLKIFRCVPFWAVVVSGISYTWGNSTVQNFMPSFINSVYHFDITKNGALSAGISLSSFLGNILFPYIEYLLSSYVTLTLTAHRKLWSCVTMYGSSVVLLILAFFSLSSTSVSALLIIGGVFNGSLPIAYICSIIDMSPNFAGVAASFLHAAQNSAAIVAPTLTGFMILDEKSLADWQKVFVIMGGVMAGGCTFFLIFGSSEEQNWNVVQKDNEAEFSGQNSSPSA